MSVTKTSIDNFLILSEKFWVIDVRSPAEFSHAHIPGAYNLPLFDDNERKVVGTAYKQESKESAIKIGLRYFGPKMVEMLEEVEAMAKIDDKNLTDRKTVLVHCWRGGMRSAGVAWLLDLYGFKVYTLSGGYKAFRQWCHRQFETKYNLKVIGGYTGSGKTGIVAEMRQSKLPAVDLEGIANHKGSSFGSIGMPVQPSQEMFENLLALELSRVGSGSKNSFPPDHNDPAFLSTESDQFPVLEFSTIWLEDESQRIGNVIIPAKLWEQMRTAHVYFLDIPFERRLEHIVKDYGKGDKDKLVNAIIRIQKRLGGLETKNAINYLVEDNLKDCFKILLSYYDKYYFKGLQSRENWEQLSTTINCQDVDSKLNILKLLSAVELA
jgi:tRNA 2-selenouridine synthase